MLDFDYPAAKPAPTFLPAGPAFASHFAIPFTSLLGITFTRQITLPELLACYSIPDTVIPSPVPLNIPLGTFDTSLSCCCPFGLAKELVGHLLDTHLFTFLDAFNSPLEFLTRSFLAKPSCGSPIPTLANWYTAYADDPDMALLFSSLTSPLTKLALPFPLPKSIPLTATTSAVTKSLLSTTAWLSFKVFKITKSYSC
jgi:hypothetical protein